MLVYVAVFALAVGVARVAETNWKTRAAGDLPRKFSIIALTVAIILAGVSSLRWEVGTDYKTYVRLFPRYVTEFTQDFHLFGEPGIRLIAWISAKLNGDSATMFAVAAIITIGLFTRSLWRWSPAFSFSIAIFILSGGWHGSFNVVRQYIACAILFAGHRLIIQRRLGLWLFVVLLATLFHTSAIAGLLMYLIPTKKTSIKIQLVILAIGIVGLLTMGMLIDFLATETEDVQRWGSEYVARGINPLRVAFSFIPIVLYWILNTRKKVDLDQASFYVNMLMVYGSIHLATLNSTLVSRFALYPLPFVAIGLAYITAVESPKERSIVRVILSLVFAIFMYFEIISTTSLSDFKWIFERPS